MSASQNYSFKASKNIVVSIRNGKTRARADTLAVTLLTSSQINSQVSPVWLPLSSWSLGDREEVLSSGLCVHLRAEMKLYRQCVVCCHAELYLHPKLLWLLGLCCCLSAHHVSLLLRESMPANVCYGTNFKKEVTNFYYLWTTDVVWVVQSMHFMIIWLQSSEITNHYVFK